MGGEALFIIAAVLSGVMLLYLLYRSWQASHCPLRVAISTSIDWSPHYARSTVSAREDRLEELAPRFAGQYKAATLTAFRKSLLKLEGAFVAWRYVYEKDAPLTYDVPLAIATMAALRERCQELLKA